MGESKMHIVIPHTFGILRLLMSATDDDHKRSGFIPRMKNVAKNFSYEMKDTLIFLSRNVRQSIYFFPGALASILLLACHRRTCQREDVCNNRCDKRAEFALSTPDFADKRNVCRIDRRRLALTTEAKTAIKFARYSVTILPES